jgi:hypothetical protein
MVKEQKRRHKVTSCSSPLWVSLSLRRSAWIPRCMVHQIMNVNIAMSFSSTVESEVHNVMHQLFITIVAMVENLIFLHIDQI